MPDLTPHEQYQALNVLEYLSDLFTASLKETFTRGDILVILNLVRSDPEIFDWDVIVAQQQASADVEE